MIATSRSTRSRRTARGRRTTPPRLAPITSCGAMARRSSLPVTITNCCNNYGPYQFPEKVIPLFATRALSGQSLPLYQSTENRREWLHVDDHCRAVEAVLERGRIGETYHVGSGREASITEIADAVLAAAGQPGSLKTIVPDRPGHDRRYLLDSSKIRGELGWEPEVPFDSGLEATVRWYGDEPGLVGAADRSLPGGRDLLAQTILPTGDRDRRAAGHMRVLVTGAGGQVGSRVVALLKERSAGRVRDPIDLVAADHLQLDVSNRDRVLAAICHFEPDLIIHPAAWTAVDACEADPDRAFGVNALGTRHVAEALDGSGPTSATSRPTTSSTVAPTAPYLEWDTPEPALGLRPLQARRRARARSRLDDRPDGMGRRPAAAPTWRRRCCAWRGRSRRSCASWMISVAARPSRPSWPPRSSSSPLARRPGVFHVTNQGATTWFGFAREVLRCAGRRSRRAWSRSQPLSSTRRARHRGRPTPCSTTPRCVSRGRRSCRTGDEVHRAARPRAAIDAAGGATGSCDRRQLQRRRGAGAVRRQPEGRRRRRAGRGGQPVIRRLGGLVAPGRPRPEGDRVCQEPRLRRRCEPRRGLDHGSVPAHLQSGPRGRARARWDPCSPGWRRTTRSPSSVPFCASRRRGLPIGPGLPWAGRGASGTPASGCSGAATRGLVVIAISAQDQHRSRSADWVSGAFMAVRRVAFE